MSTWAVLATGESMSQAVADRVRAAGIPAVAVSDAFRLAPWAVACCAADASWWKHPNNADAADFAGEKWCSNGAPPAGVLRIRANTAISSGSNSGIIGLDYALQRGGATRVLLFGIDMVGSHYFGRHPEGLGNTTQGRFAVFMNEFKVYAELRIKPGVEVFNLSPISALDVFPKRSLDDLEALCKP